MESFAFKVTGNALKQAVKAKMGDYSDPDNLLEGIVADTIEDYVVNAVLAGGIWVIKHIDRETAVELGKAAVGLTAHLAATAATGGLALVGGVGMAVGAVSAGGFLLCALPLFVFGLWLDDGSKPPCA